MAYTANYAIGDITNYATLLNTVGFMVVVLSHHFGLLDVLDPSFANDGFCIANKQEVAYSLTPDPIAVPTPRCAIGSLSTYRATRYASTVTLCSPSYSSC